MSKIKNKIQFFIPPNEDVNLVRSLEPKEKHFHFFRDLSKGIDQYSLICIGPEKCPICNFASKKKKNFFFRFKIFIFDIKENFKKLFKN